jgi:adenylate cyclase
MPGDAEPLRLQILGPAPAVPVEYSLTPGQTLFLGREHGCQVLIQGDPQISRRHLELVVAPGQISVRRLPQARNPLFFSGAETEHCLVLPGEQFVVGSTCCRLLAGASGPASPHSGTPVEEVAFTPAALAQVAYRDAERRLDALTQLPALIHGAPSETELQRRLAQVLLAGVPRAEVAGVVAAPRGGSIRWLESVRRHETAGTAPLSQRLARGAIVERRQTLLHVWERTQPSTDYTTLLDCDWALCTPVEGAGEEPWGLYLAGRLDGNGRETATADLRTEAKFVGLMAEIVGSIRQLSALERRQAGLRKFLPPSVLTAMGDETDPDRLSPRESLVTVLFCDLRGFSRRAESARNDLPALLKRVSEALGVMTSCISHEGGVIGDFQGDAAMGFWGWPVSAAEDGLHACRAALAIRRAFHQARATPGHPLADFRVGIGLAQGRAVAGRIGTEEHFVFTAFGPVVNLASRLEGQSRTLRVPIVIDESLATAVRAQLPPGEARLRRLARILPLGLDTPTLVHELLPGEGPDCPLTTDHLQAYDQAVDQFLAGDWERAWATLRALPAEDEAQDFLTLQITQHNRQPPADWNGIIRMTAK